MKCSYCGRESTDDAGECRGCGTAFEIEPGDARSGLEVAPGNPARAAAEKRMLYGALWFVGGILVTVVSYVSAASGPFGGTYLVAWGAILFGAVRFFQGLSGRDAKPRGEEKPGSEEVGYEALAYAAKLETEGRVQEALAVYQRIVEQCPDTDVSNDAKKSIDSLQAKLR